MMQPNHYTDRPGDHRHVFMICFSMILCITILFAFYPSDACFAAERQSFKHQITGLFSPDRVKDFREVVVTLPNIKLGKIDYKQAEAEFIYDPAELFPNAKSEQIVERLDNLLRSASTHTFGVKPLCTMQQEELKFIEIAVAGLDCKACCLAAYESIYRIDGVQRATASFKEGLVTAWIDPSMTDRAALVDALRKKGVAVTPDGSGDTPE